MPAAISYLPHRVVDAYDLAMPQRQSDTPSPDQVILGTRIARVLREKELSQTYVARKLGVRNATVGDWVAGRFTPRGDNLRQLAEVLDMTVDELMDVTEGKPPPFEAWSKFLEKHPGLEDKAREFLRRQPWPDGHEPTLATYEMLLGIFRSTST